MPKLHLDLPDIFTLIQGIIGAIIVGVWAALLLMGRPVPQEVSTLVTFVVGYFFGGLSSNLVNRMKGSK